ncbi:MAG: helix-turn-helix domain-containing protein [Alphaproteobacteria bacterium]|nr:helix-turn-helix domain-containing protein [Alphaproteobacteria bacterium]
MTNRYIMTVPEAGAILGVSKNCAYEMVQRGEIPTVKIGRLLKVPKKQFFDKFGLGEPDEDGDTGGGPTPPSADTAPAAAAGEQLGPEVVADSMLPAFPAPVPPVERSEPVVRRADDTGLLNLDYILANAAAFSNVSAVYFLCSAEEVVYVGKSTEVYERISNHAREGKRRFSRVFMLSCAPRDLDYLERRYIAKFQPRYNVIGKGPRCIVRPAEEACDADL